jgi:hypothetical protein
MLYETEHTSSRAAWPRPSLALKEPIMTCIVWIPSTPGKWVHLDHGHADSFDFARVPAVGEFIRHTGRHYQVKLVTHDTPPGATPTILHAVPVEWDDMLNKAHPAVQSSSLGGQQ